MTPSQPCDDVGASCSGGTPGGSVETVFTGGPAGAGTGKQLNTLGGTPYTGTNCRPRTTTKAEHVIGPLIGLWPTVQSMGGSIPFAVKSEIRFRAVNQPCPGHVAPQGAQPGDEEIRACPPGQRRLGGQAAGRVLWSIVSNWSMPGYLPGSSFAHLEWGVLKQEVHPLHGRGELLEGRLVVPVEPVLRHSSHAVLGHGGRQQYVAAQVHAGRDEVSPAGLDTSHIRAQVGGRSRNAQVSSRRWGSCTSGMP